MVKQRERDKYKWMNTAEKNKIKKKVIGQIL